MNVLAINQETISNKAFTEVANDVINTAECLEIEAHSSELLTMMALSILSKPKLMLHF